MPNKLDRKYLIPLDMQKANRGINNIMFKSIILLKKDKNDNKIINKYLT